MADDWRGTLIKIYIGLPQIFKAFFKISFFKNNYSIVQK